jgi:hypothetical protein
MSDNTNDTVDNKAENITTDDTQQDSDVEAEIDDDEVADLMRENVQRLLKLEEEMKVISASLKARRDKKKEICDVLMVYLAKRNIGHVHLDGAYKGTKLVYQVGENRSKFSPDQIKQILQDSINKPDVVNKIHQLILDKQTVKQTSKLKLTKPKKNKQKHSDKMINVLNDEQTEEDGNDDLPPHLQYLADV